MADIQMNVRVKKVVTAIERAVTSGKAKNGVGVGLLALMTDIPATELPGVVETAVNQGKLVAYRKGSFRLAKSELIQATWGSKTGNFKGRKAAERAAVAGTEGAVS